jgi:hypothetical protein
MDLEPGMVPLQPLDERQGLKAMGAALGPEEVDLDPRLALPGNSHPWDIGVGAPGAHDKQQANEKKTDREHHRKVTVFLGGPETGLDRGNIALF